jgi:amidase
MAAGKESEERYKRGTQRLLEGITVAIKDENERAGWRVTMGSLAYKDAPLAKENSAIIDALEAAGAVMHIQTTVPELYMSVSASTYAWGTTRNPWNLDYSPGGSSSGSSTALAAGFATLATGSDMGGSIRLPACWVRVLAVARLGAHYPRIRESFQRL